MSIEAIRLQQKPDMGGEDIASLVCRDIELRADLGKKRYGKRLQSCNGRDALVDAYQEALDLAMYLRQLIEERITKPKPNKPHEKDC